LGAATSGGDSVSPGRIVNFAARWTLVAGALAAELLADALAAAELLAASELLAPAELSEVVVPVPGLDAVVAVMLELVEPAAAALDRLELVEAVDPPQAPSPSAASTASTHERLIAVEDRGGPGRSP
jgi:hypothetical protein